MQDKLKLLPHQEEGIIFSKKRASIPILCDMGLGKTALSLGICKDRGLKKVLCVVPKSVIDNWLKDIKKFTEFSCAVALGNREKRIANILAPVEIILINFEGVRILEKELEKLASQKYFDGLIIDELARVRRYSKQTQALQKIAKYFPTRIGLSGLLIAESLMDAFNPFKILDLGQCFGTDFFLFREKYFVQDSSEGEYAKYVATEYGKKVITSLIKSNSYIKTAEQVGLLPATSFVTRKVVLSEQQLDFLKTLQEEWRSSYPKLDIEAQYNYTIQIIQKSLQCISGFNYLDNKEVYWFDYNPKAQELNALVEELGSSPFLVWCNYKAEKALVEKMLVSLGKKVCPSDEPSKFDDSNYDCFIGTYSKDSQGHNFKRAKTAILFSRPNSYEKYYQALGRNRRQTSEYNLISYQIITSKYPTEYLNDLALKKKQDLAGLLRTMDLKDIWQK